jgi:hypothetical protein
MMRTHLCKLFNRSLVASMLPCLPHQLAVALKDVLMQTAQYKVRCGCITPSKCADVWSHVTGLCAQSHHCLNNIAVGLLS